MAITYVDVVSEQVPATNTTLYTAIGTNLTTSHIIYAVIHNATATRANIKVNIVQSSDSVAASNRYIDENIPPNSSVTLYNMVGAVLSPGDFISAIAGTASALNLKLGIKEITT